MVRIDQEKSRENTTDKKIMTKKKTKTRAAASLQPSSHLKTKKPILILLVICDKTTSFICAASDDSLFSLFQFFSTFEIKLYINHLQIIKNRLVNAVLLHRFVLCKSLFITLDYMWILLQFVEYHKVANSSTP